MTKTAMRIALKTTTLMRSRPSIRENSNRIPA